MRRTFLPSWFPKYSKRNPSGNHRSLIDLSDVSARTRQRRSIAYSVHPIYDLNRELAIRRDIYQAEPPWRPWQARAKSTRWDSEPGGGALPLLPARIKPSAQLGWLYVINMSPCRHRRDEGLCGTMHGIVSSGAYYRRLGPTLTRLRFDLLRRRPTGSCKARVGGYLRMHRDHCWSSSDRSRPYTARVLTGGCCSRVAGFPCSCGLIYVGSLR
jgi:hypothetical protein